MSSATHRKLPQIWDLPADQVTPAVLTLLEICHELREENQALRDEIARLKGQKPRLKVKPSKLESGQKGKKQAKQGRRGKRGKTSELAIHEEVCLPPEEEVPAGSRFKGYEEFTVQDIRIELHHTRYRMERWVTPNGEHLLGKLPAEVGGVHFGPSLRTFILYQYHHAHVTQPLLLEQLREWGIDISAGQLSAIITEGKAGSHGEKEALLRVGLQRSRYIHVDDTGARHQGKNGYCTHIGNELFAYFASTDSKSRINFLELLRAGRDEDTLNEEALAYMEAQKLPQEPLGLLSSCAPRTAAGRQARRASLGELGITTERHIRIATEGALLGTVIEHGVNPQHLAIVSDDAGQFNVLVHALCWVHAERVFVKLVGFNDAQREALAWVRSEIWAIYALLKAYQADPEDEKKAQREARFDTLCTTKTCFARLNQAVRRMHQNQTELLRVLERPDLPLHNNLSERDIREYVKKRKISGATRSDEGRRSRDTFASLKKTCRKNGVSFWQYLLDRICGTGQIPPLAAWIFAPASAVLPIRSVLQPSEP